MDLTLSRVVEAARQRRAAVTAEVGGYIVLLVLQQQAGGPRRVSPELIGLTASGEVELAPSSAAEPREVETALRGLLASLLALSQSAPPALRATSARGVVGDLAAFEAELTAALIPINHAAARRALARVFRETQKAPRLSLAPERESAPSPASVPLPEPSAPVPASVRASVAETPALEPRVVTPTPVSVRASAAPERMSARPELPLEPEPRASVVAAPEAPPPASVIEPAEELEIDVDVDVLLAEPEPIAAAAVPAEPEPAEPELELEVVAEVDVEELDRLLSSEPPPSIAASPASRSAPVSSPVASSPVASSPAPVAAPVSAEAAELEANESAPASLVHSLTPAARALTPQPASAVRRNGSAAAEEELERESPVPDSLSRVARSDAVEPTPERSDLRELLDGFLSHTRSEENMAAGLRRMIGLEPWRASGLGSERTGLGQ